MKRIFLSLLFAAGLTTVWATETALSGKFTINDKGDQVQFAPGNLQYVPSTDTWQFATSQIQIIGVDQAAANEIANYAGAIDLFPWGDNYGSHIGEGWRMLTSEEWAYLLREDELDPGSGPENAGQATIVTQHGLMLLPDGWTEFGELTFSASPNNWTTNNYTAANWTELEKSGVVFLPCAGFSSNGNVQQFNAWGCYWSSSIVDEDNGASVFFNELYISPYGSTLKTNGGSLRLVKDVAKDPTGVEPTANAKAKAIKTIRNGQIVIIRDNKTYTMIGQEK